MPEQTERNSGPDDSIHPLLFGPHLRPFTTVCGEHLQTQLSANEISAHSAPLGSSSPSPRRWARPAVLSPTQGTPREPRVPLSEGGRGETPPTLARPTRGAGPQGEESGDEQTGSRRAPTPRRRADTSENGSLTALPRDSRTPGAVRQPQTRGQGLRHLLLMPADGQLTGWPLRPAPRSQAESVAQTPLFYK